MLMVAVLLAVWANAGWASPASRNMIDSADAKRARARPRLMTLLQMLPTNPPVPLKPVVRRQDRSCAQAEDPREQLKSP